MKKNINVEYTVQIWKEGKRFVAHAMPLDIMSCGESTEQASKALDEVLEEAGYEHSNKSWQAPLWVSFEKHSAVIGA